MSCHRITRIFTERMNSDVRFMANAVSSEFIRKRTVALGKVN